MNNKEISVLTHKIMSLQSEIKDLKKPKDISKIKEKIMLLVQEINIIEFNSQGDNPTDITSKKFINDITITDKIQCGN